MPISILPISFCMQIQAPEEQDRNLQLLPVCKRHLSGERCIQLEHNIPGSGVQIAHQTSRVSPHEVVSLYPGTETTCIGYKI